MVGVSFSRVDSESVQPIFYDNLTDEIAKKITLKTKLTISIGTMGIRAYSVAVIPLVDEGAVSFVYVHKSDIDNSVFSFSYIVNSEKQLTLYKRIPVLERVTKEFIADTEKKGKLNDLTVPLLKNYSDRVQQLCEKLLISDESVDILLKEKSQSQLSGVDKSLVGLLKKIKNPDVIYRSFLLNIPVVIIADKIKDSDLDILPWDDFVPHKTLNINAWPPEPTIIDDFDLMFVDEEHKAKCHSRDDCTILDWHNGKVSGGKQDKYLSKLLDEIKKSKEPLAELTSEFNNIFYWVQEIIDITTKQKDDVIDKKIREMINYHSRAKYCDRLPLVATVARKYNYFVGDRIASYFLKELGITDKAINSKKILSKL